MNWLHYLLEANLYLGVFYLGYYLFLSRETYYTLNRVYLLFSCVVSFALPVMQLGLLKPLEEPVTAVNFTFAPQATTYAPVRVAVEAVPVFTWQDGLVYCYLLGAGILFVVLLMKLYSLLKLTRAKNPVPDDSYKLVYLNQSTTAFSFFNYLFIGTQVQGSETIIKHELVHIRQKHSADIIFIELLKIVNWFNPFIYLIQYSLKTIHEYIADEKTASSENDTLAYSSFLVNNAYGLGGSSVTHSFFNYNLLKKRIIMLHQKRSGSLARLKYLVAVPICGGLLCASTLAFSKNYGWVDIGPLHRINKNNKSLQVLEPNRRLLVRQNGLSYLTDKFSDKRLDGTTRIYTAYNLSNKDRVDLAKRGIQLNILSDVKIDTIKAHIAPPPPPAPPVTKVKFPAPKRSFATTSKGYEYAERASEINGKTDMEVIIYEKGRDIAMFDKNTSSPKAIELLKEKYGYTFPAHIKMPPPPPAPPVPGVHKLPPPVVKVDPPVAAKQMPPPPPVAFTKKGYKYSEDGYVINGKTDFRVIITEKNGEQKAYFRSKVSDADLKLLNDKYGYKFPVMEIYTKLPPPPPTPAAPVAPVQSKKALIYKVNPDSTLTVTDHTPVIVVNGEIYNLKEPLAKGHELLVDATGGEHAVVYTDKDLQQAIAKYGENAKNGVIFAYGVTKVTVK